MAKLKQKKLKPCPICGSRATAVNSGWREPTFDICCNSKKQICNVVMHGEPGVDHNEMVRRWNTRARDDR